LTPARCCSKSYFAQELCAEARKGPIDPRAQDRAPHEGIEFLELYQQWGLDTGTHEYSGKQHLQLRGIGHELDDDVSGEGRKKGERVDWSVSLTPARELLLLPVRVKAEVRITEDDADAKAFMQEIRQTRHSDVTLGQVIHGLLWELSFHGGPEQQLEMSEDLRRRVAKLDARTAEMISGDVIFERLHRPGCDALFDELGGRTSREIAAALRNIDDDENAAAWFDSAFSGEVVVKVQFRDRTGRDFRKAFRAAGR
jgi:hypothetical protein